jgi:hypothetical protein
MATYLSIKPQIFPVLNEQIDQIKQKKALKLNNIIHTNKFLLSEVIECIHEFLYSFKPPLELECLSLQSNLILELPANFSIISKNIKFLDLYNNNLTALPNLLREFTSLEVLDLASNKLWNLPSILVMGKLSNLKVISLKENKFKYLPPVLGEMTSLNLIEVADNPLVLPSLDLIKAFKKQRPELDWVRELKIYLLSNKSVLEYKLAEQQEAKQLRPNATLPPLPQQPSIARSKSISETKSKASKAARRMGLIIKKPDENSDASQSGTISGPSTAHPSSTSYDLDTSSNNVTLNVPPEYSLPLNLPHSASATETSFNFSTSPITSGSSAIHATNSQTNSLSTSPAATPTTKPTAVISTSANSSAVISSSTSSSNASTLSRPSSRNRSRSNTLKEIDRILEKNDIVDTEHKSGAYFRRLSTLQENPIDENLPHHSHSFSLGSARGIHPPQPTQVPLVQETVQRQHLLLLLYSLRDDNDILNTLKSPPSVASRNNSIVSNEVSPSKGNISTRKINPSAMVRVSRKILFSFSELHSSVRRFTGFCTDKKITIKMVSFLYTTKSNIDSLVENLEVMEETGNNTDQISTSLQTCILSFKSIMNLLSDNFQTFVLKIDVCFIRMLYLTLYGSFNELLNAYRILLPNSKVPQFSLPQTSGPVETKQKLTINTNTYDSEDVDEKLYRSIEIATTNAQVVFGELTKAIGKSAVASATTSSASGINHTVATRVKELTNVCMSSMDITKQLKIKLLTIRNEPTQPTRRLFWDDINMFLKAIIQTFSSVKGVMKDLPILNDIRSSMANLTKTTKDLTILLEVSSYKTMSSENNNSSNHNNSSLPPPLSSIPSVSNIFAPASAHPGLQSHSLSLVNLSQMNNNLLFNNLSNAQPVRTPLVSNLGAALASIPPNFQDNQANNNFNSPMESPKIHGSAPVTAPVQSTGLYFAKNGMNPFDGLIIANREREMESHETERLNNSFNL